MKDIWNLLEDEFESKVLREAARSLNFIGILAEAYRAPELLEFLEKLSRGIDRWKRTTPRRRNVSLN